jgi:alpha-L-arabinofuranosidase B-like protein
MTVYGSEPRGTHAAVKVLVGAAVVVILAAVAVVWHSAAGGDAEPAAQAATTSPSPSVKASSAPLELAAGSWLLSLGGESGGYLTVAGEYAGLSADERTVFTVVKGLADDSCFSFQAPSGKYLRHFDYRLRFDKTDDSDLYRQDATFCPLDDAPAGAVRLRSANYPDHVVHSRDDGLYIDKPDDSGDFEAESSFKLEKG